MRVEIIPCLKDNFSYLIIDESNATLEKVVSIEGNRTFENTILPFDDLSNFVGPKTSVVSVLNETHANASIRAACKKSLEEVSLFSASFNLNEDYYKVVKEYSESQDYKLRKATEQRFVDEKLKSFELNGFALNKEKRD